MVAPGRALNLLKISRNSADIRYCMQDGHDTTTDIFKRRQ